MRHGTHNRKLRSSWWLGCLKASKFKPKLFRWPVKDLKGSCGTAAISTITGINPTLVDKKMPKTNDYWTDRAMKKFLKKHGYVMTEITVSRVTQNPDYQEEPITPNHILLVSQEVCYGEGTWAVIHDHKRYHNFEEEPLDPFEFINQPTMTVYSISHKKWQNLPPKNYKVRYDPMKNKVVPA